jgi:hypothetical protein
VGVLREGQRVTGVVPLEPRFGASLRRADENPPFGVAEPGEPFGGPASQLKKRKSAVCGSVPSFTEIVKRRQVPAQVGSIAQVYV